MKHSTMAAFAAVLLGNGFAQAQTTPSNANPATRPADASSARETGTGPVPPPTALGTTKSAAPLSNQTRPALATEENRSTPVAGSNSFTEAQARSRIAEGGFTDVGGLKLDGQGIWRGVAMKSGKQVNVGLDYQGNIISR